MNLLAALRPVALIALTLGMSLGVLTGCASQKTCVAPVGPSGLTPETAASLRQGEGSVVTWGGTIASTRNQPDTTEIETIGYRLDRCGKPMTSGQPIGRFIAIQRGFLEPSDYREGRQITATGRIGPVREGHVGEANYSFAVLHDVVIRLWPEEQASAQSGWTPRPRPWISIGVGSGGYSGVGGGIGLGF